MVQINAFKLERYFARYEFKAPYLLSPSDCECVSMRELLSLADPEMRKAWDTLALGYTESAGHPLLRDEVARMYDRIKKDGVLIAVPEEAILIAMQALLAPGDHIIVTFPCYQSLYEIARSLDCNITHWTLEASTGGWRLDLQFLADHITARTKLLVINFPHNPTGYLPSREDFDAIMDMARQHNLRVFSDEMYRFLEYEIVRQLPSACDVYERAITLSGLSKSLGLPGLRVGWLATANLPVVSEFMRMKDYTTICGGAPSEILAIIALRAKDVFISRNLGILRDNLATADRFFEHFSHFFHWLRPLAGSVAFPSLTSGMSIDHFCRDLLEREGVMVVPGSLFEFPGNHFRVGLGRKSFPEALKRVEAYLTAVHAHQV
jgi:aspartate/methionine/tyrosine aminotransferase